MNATRACDPRFAPLACCHSIASGCGGGQQQRHRQVTRNPLNGGMRCAAQSCHCTRCKEVNAFPVRDSISAAMPMQFRDPRRNRQSAREPWPFAPREREGTVAQCALRGVQRTWWCRGPGKAQLAVTTAVRRGRVRLGMAGSGKDAGLQPGAMPSPQTLAGASDCSFAREGHATSCEVTEWPRSQGTPCRLFLNFRVLAREGSVGRVQQQLRQRGPRAEPRAREIRFAALRRARRGAEKDLPPLGGGGL